MRLGKEQNNFVFSVTFISHQALSGYESIKIYLQGNSLVMLLEYPEDIDIDNINERYAGSHPEKKKEWARIMSKFQKAPPGADTSQRWVEMERIYEFKNE